MADIRIEEKKKYKENYGNDNIRYKEIIKKKLSENTSFLAAINNKEFDPEEPDDYFGENILPYYLLTNTQTKVQNYICYETNFTEVVKYNKIIKLGQIIFYILCSETDIYDKQSGIARHDLLAAYITDTFNWCHDFGTQIHLVSDKPYAVDNNFVLRTLTFEQETPNAIVDAQTKTVINQTR